MKPFDLTKFIKNKNNLFLVFILVIGIVLMLFSDTEKKTPELSKPVLSEQEELLRVMSQIDGVGKADVIITYYGDATKRIVYDTKTRGDQTDKTAVVSGGEAVITGVNYPRVKGVVVVSEGADNPAVCTAIKTAVMTALDVPEYKVCVLKGR